MMDELGRYDDIALPSKQVDCVDNEILHPKRVRKYRSYYQQHSAVQITDEVSFINAFFAANQHAEYAGFKSMPNRHRQLHAVVQLPMLQVITLDRSDLASTVASFIVASDKNTWRRYGGEQDYSFTFEGEYVQRALSHLRYIVQSRNILKQIPRAIHLKYEDLCRSDFHHQALDDYFERHIALENPKSATVADHYVTNWDSFKAFIEEQHQRLIERISRQRA